ncbi:hypothetical protein FQR65_LT10975 [Abscondita terminalis]|nr:hypothetical protein FQR65_LT10975 [Abscondita terminalis]
MDTKALIAAVFKQIPIWDKRQKSHSNRNIVEKRWKKIGEEMNIQDDTVKPRASKVNCSQTTLNENLSENQVPDMDENSAPDLSVQNENSFEQTENKPDNNSHSQNDVISPTVSHTAPKRKRSQMDSFNVEMVNIEKQKLEILKAKKENLKTDDEDMIFFKSLLPNVQKIPPNLKFSFRKRVRDIVNNFAYGQITSVPEISPIFSTFSYTSSVPESPRELPIGDSQFDICTYTNLNL